MEERSDEKWQSVAFVVRRFRPEEERCLSKLPERFTGFALANVSGASSWEERQGS